MKFRTVKDSYIIKVRLRRKEIKSDGDRQLKTEKLELSFQPSGNFQKLKYKDRIIGNGDFLKSFITYGGEKYYFTPSEITACGSPDLRQRHSDR